MRYVYQIDQFYVYLVGGLKTVLWIGWSNPFSTTWINLEKKERIQIQTPEINMLFSKSAMRYVYQIDRLRV